MVHLAIGAPQDVNYLIDVAFRWVKSRILHGYNIRYKLNKEKCVLLNWSKPCRGQPCLQTQSARRFSLCSASLAIAVAGGSPLCCRPDALKLSVWISSVKKIIRFHCPHPRTRRPVLSDPLFDDPAFAQAALQQAFDSLPDGSGQSLRSAETQVPDGPVLILILTII